MRLSKRDLVRLSGIAVVTGLAGCQTTTGGDDDERATTPRDAGGGSGTTNMENREAEIEFVDTDTVTTLPIVRPDTIGAVASVELEITDPDGVQNVAVTYTDDYRDGPLLVAGETGIEGDAGTDGHTIQLTGEFPRRMVAPSTGEFTVEVTDSTGNTQTKTEPIKTQTRGWLVDRGDEEYQTERTWDDLDFDREQFINNHVSEGKEEAVYDVVLQELEEGNTDKYTGSNAQAIYSNSHHKLGQEDRGGYWNPEFFNELTSLEHILGDARNAILTHQRIAHPTAYSAWNNRCSATLEDIVHKFNGEAKEHLEQTGEKAVHAGYVNEGGHGTVITHTDLENTNIEGEHPWQFVDTTTSNVAPLSQDYINTRGRYNPFVDRYKSDEQLGEYDTAENPDESEVLYRNEKRITSQALRSFILDNDFTDGLEGSMWGISDSVLEDIFNDHVPSGGSIDPILDMLEKTIDLQIDTGKSVQVYGEDLENYQIAVAEGEGLYEMSRDPEIQVTEEEVENYLMNSPA